MIYLLLSGSKSLMCNIYLFSELKKAWEEVIEMRNKKLWFPSESEPQKHEK